MRKKDLAVIYRCSMYKKRGCKARIRYYSEPNLFIHVNEHEYHSIEHLEKQKKPPLEEDRRSLLYEFIKSNTHIRSSKLIRQTLNNNLPDDKKDNPRYVITEEDVSQMKRKFYSERIYCLQDIYSRSDVAQTKNGEQFVRWVQGFPHFLLVFASNYQLNLLKSVTMEDQLYVDGTFDICPEGCEQMVTLHIRKKEQPKSFPCLFAFMQNAKELDYWYLWWVIIYLVPELDNVKKLFIACDFEIAMHNAVKKHFKCTEIVGCMFHFFQAINRWIKNKLPSDHIFKTYANVRTELFSQLKNLITTKLSEEEFNLAKENFISKWRTIAGSEFAKYLIKNWLGDSMTKARFGPETWALSFKSRIHDLDLTDNQAELFHRNLNRRFAEKPQLKRAIDILKEIVEEYTSNDIVEKRKKILTNLSVADETLRNRKIKTGLKIVSNVKSKKRARNTYSLENKENILNDDETEENKSRKQIKFIQYNPENSNGKKQNVPEATKQFPSKYVPINRADYQYLIAELPFQQHSNFNWAGNSISNQNFSNYQFRTAPVSLNQFQPISQPPAFPNFFNNRMNGSITNYSVWQAPSQ